MSATLTQLRRSLDVIEACDKIIPWPVLSEISSKLFEAHGVSCLAFSAHGTDAQELRRQLRELIKAHHETGDLIAGLEEGLGR